MLFDLLSAKLDFESSNPILTTDVTGRSINSSCFGIDLFIYDEQASQVEARKGAHHLLYPLHLVTCTLALNSRLLCAKGALDLSVGSCGGKPGVVGLVGGQIPSNCEDSAGITTALQVPQLAWGCAMPLQGDFDYFTRTHQMDVPYGVPPAACCSSGTWTHTCT